MIPNKVCLSCKNKFECTQDMNCWCMTMPNAIPLPVSNSNLPSLDCLCPDCLQNKINSQTQKLNSEDYYFNSDGLMVMTKEYLKRRGYFCKNGCQNCPY